MPGYWRGSMTPRESNRSLHFVEEEVSGYENMKECLTRLDSGNVNTDQIVLLFTASETKDNRGEDEKDNHISKVQRTWNTDCDIFEEVVDLLKTQVVNPVGWMVKVRLTQDEWSDTKSPFRLDDEIGLTELPTMIVYNTMKRISGRKAFNMDNIIIMLED